MRPLKPALLVALVALILPGAAEARIDWRGLLDCLGRGSSGWAGEAARQDQARVSGFNRVRDGAIRVWRGPTRLQTLVHELLHRATAGRPSGVLEQLRRLTGDLQVDEGLTTYFTARALERSRLPMTVAEPAPGATFSRMRAWATGLRSTAQGAIRAAYGVEVALGNIAILSDRSFARVYEWAAERPWQRPRGAGSYPASHARVRELVQLVGEEPVRRAYFTGDVTALRTALQQARSRLPARSFPSWVEL